MLLVFKYCFFLGIVCMSIIRIPIMGTVPGGQALQIITNYCNSPVSELWYAIQVMVAQLKKWQ
jgi:hypothetical protein